MPTLNVSPSFLDYCHASQSPHCYFRYQPSVLKVEKPSQYWLGRVFFWIKRHTFWRNQYCLNHIIEALSRVPVHQVLCEAKPVPEDTLKRFFCKFRSAISSHHHKQLQKLFCSHFYYATSKSDEELFTPLQKNEYRPLPGLNIHFEKPFSPDAIHFISTLASQETLKNMLKDAKKASSCGSQQEHSPVVVEDWHEGPPKLFENVQVRSRIPGDNREALKTWFHRRFKKEKLFTELLSSKRQLLFLDWEIYSAHVAIYDITYLLSTYPQEAQDRLRTILIEMKRRIKDNRAFLKNDPPPYEEHISSSKVSAIKLLDPQEFDVLSNDVMQLQKVNDILSCGSLEQLSTLRQVIEAKIDAFTRAHASVPSALTLLLSRVTQCNAHRTKLEDAMNNPGGLLSKAWKNLETSDEKELLEYIIHRKPLRKQMKIQLRFLHDQLSQNETFLLEYFSPMQQHNSLIV